MELRWLVGIGALVVAAVASALVMPWWISANGPLGSDWGDDYVMTGMSPAPVGRQVAFGSGARNDTKYPIELISAELLPAKAAGTAVLVDTRAGDTAIGVVNWPSEYGNQKNTRPLAGYVIPPGGEAQFLYIVDVRKPGESYWQKTVVTYRVGSRTYKSTRNHRIQVCTSDDVCTDDWP